MVEIEEDLQDCLRDVNERMINPVAKATCHCVPLDCDITIIRIYRGRRDMNKQWDLLRDMRYSPSSCQDIGTRGAIDSPQSSTYSFNRPSTVDAGGRPTDSWARWATHVATNSSHSVSESPEGGLSGRSPFMTLSITVSLRETSANGMHPVRTYRG